MPRRRSQQAAFSLFSFQDIITSVTGIMILITLMLAIELLDRTDSKSAATNKAQLDDLKEINAEMEQQIERIKANIAAQQTNVEDLPSLDETTLRNMKKTAEDGVGNLESDIEIQKDKLKKNRETLAEKTKQESQRKAREERELQALKDRNDRISQELAEFSSSDRKFFTTGIKDKDVWVVEFARGQIRAAKIGVQMRPQAFSSAAAFLSWVRSLPNQSAMYLLVKPSAIDLYRSTRDNLPAGVDTGFSVIDEGETIMDPVVGVGKP